MKTLILGGLLFAQGVHADQQLQVTEAHLPTALAWGSNAATIAIRNSGAAPREVAISWGSRCTAVPRGWGYDDKVVIPAGATTTLSPEFVIPAFPGKGSYT